MTIETELRAAVDRADAASRILHDVAHGDATVTVATEGGPVKSVARAIGDVETAVAGAATTVTDGLAATEAARDEAVAARDAAQAAGGRVRVSDADTTPGRLSAKLTTGAGLETAIAAPGGDERLEIDLAPGVAAGARLALAQAFI